MKRKKRTLSIKLILIGLPLDTSSQALGNSVFNHRSIGSALHSQEHNDRIVAWTNLCACSVLLSCAISRPWRKSRGHVESLVTSIMTCVCHKICFKFFSVCVSSQLFLFRFGLSETNQITSYHSQYFILLFIKISLNSQCSF